MADTKNFEIFSEYVNDFFNTEKSIMTETLAAIMPTHLSPSTNGEYITNLISVRKGARRTPTSCQATIIKKGSLGETPRSYKVTTYASSVDLYIKQANNPSYISYIKNLLDSMATDDLISILLYGEKGKKTIEKGTNLRGGILNLKGSSEFAKEVTDLKTLMEYIEEAIKKIRSEVSIMIPGKERTLGLKRYSLVVPAELELETKLHQFPGISIMPLGELLLRYKNIEIVPVLGADKLVLLPYSKYLNYFHIDTWSATHEYKSSYGQYHYEYHYSTGGVIAPAEASIITAKISSSFSENVVWDGTQNVNIVNDPLKIKKLPADQGIIDEDAPKAAQANNKKTNNNN